MRWPERFNGRRHGHPSAMARYAYRLNKQCAPSREAVICATLQELTGEDASLFENCIQMLEGFGDGKRIKVAPALFAVLQNAAQVMACDLHRQGIGDGVSGLLADARPTREEPERSRPDAR